VNNKGNNEVFWGARVGGSMVPARKIWPGTHKGTPDLMTLKNEAAVFGNHRKPPPVWEFLFHF